ncbi:LysR family transcriptional regulator [Streptosporangium roseum]|uniref:LysR family transcriptional regulator n=1 Tax=Streptosporangium roseum (strain ATCC 12428 / DSM 43021 / JCM 3005 / KCTC 9067 / NCIMB 10171 / NRRL 2505 / NI 9100) TaxID=479432 RepID=D2B7G6_STRRD|nr:LysR substrate-binding domain-containing protein [Streptosporangium roseum]ACZ91487.1 LysR family transcriptional regulator [Streptosporangium roseum DSM 43021]
MIDTRRLRTLRAVADHRTVTAAAAALHLTPSAVSQQLVALEHEVGHRLLERDGRGVRLTSVGRILLGHANEVLAQLERAGADIAAYTTGTAGEVKVASFATAIGLVVAPAVGTLRDKEPGIQVRVLDAEGDQSLTMVLDGVVDVAVAVEYRGAPAEDDRRLSRIPLYSEPFDVVLPRGHALADRIPADVGQALADADHSATAFSATDARNTLPTPGRPGTPATGGPGLPLADPTDETWRSPSLPLADPTGETWSGPGLSVADLAGETWIGPYPGNPCHDVIALACEHAGFTPEFAHSSDDFSAVVALAAAGAGVAMVPRLALRAADLSGVVIRPVAGPERRVFAAVRRGAERHPLLVPLLDILQDAASALRHTSA